MLEKRLRGAAKSGRLALVKGLLPVVRDVNSRDENGRSALWWAARNGHSNVVTSLVRKGADVNAKDTDKWSPLFAAIDARHLDVVKILVGYGADLEAEDDGDNSAANFAAGHGLSDILEFLLTAGANLEHSNSTLDTPLICAAIDGHRDVVNMLLNMKANIKAQNQNGYSCLHCAVTKSHCDVVSLLIAKGADIECKDNGLCTPLGLASLMGNTGLARILLEAGCYVNSDDVDGNTVLGKAVIEGHKDLVELLLQFGADFAERNMDGYRSLHLAAIQGYREIAEILIDAGADFDGLDPRDRSPLMCASMNGHHDVMKLLMDLGAHLDHRDEHGNASLHYAALNGLPEIAKTLIGAGADIETGNMMGSSPLCCAAICGETAVAEVLIEARACLEHRDRSVTAYPIECPDSHELTSEYVGGTTPLASAAFGGHVDVCKLLLEAGANVTKVDEFGHFPLELSIRGGKIETIELLLNVALDQCSRDTPFEFQRLVNEAVKYGYKNVLELLVQKGADVELKDQVNQSILNLSSVQGHVNIAEYLIDIGADISTRDLLDNTPLLHASFFGHLSVVELLTSKGADTNAVNKEGRDALFCAAQNGHSDVVRFLAQLGMNVNKTDNVGWCPLGAAVGRGHLECVKELVQLGARLDFRTTDDINSGLLHVAAYAGLVDIYQFLRIVGLKQEKDSEGRLPVDCFPFHDIIDYSVLDVDESDLSVFQFGRSDSEASFRHIIPEVNLSDLANLRGIGNVTSIPIGATEKVNTFVDNFVGEREDIHQRCGSSAEGTKVGLPDEVDYMLKDCIATVEANCLIEYGDGYVGIDLERGQNRVKTNSKYSGDDLDLLSIESEHETDWNDYVVETADEFDLDMQNQGKKKSKYSCDLLSSESRHETDWNDYAVETVDEIDLDTQDQGKTKSKYSCDADGLLSCESKQETHSNDYAVDTGEEIDLRKQNEGKTKSKHSPRALGMLSSKSRHVMHPNDFVVETGKVSNTGLNPNEMDLSRQNQGKTKSKYPISALGCLFRKSRHENRSNYFAVPNEADLARHDELIKSWHPMYSCSVLGLLSSKSRHETHWNDFIDRMYNEEVVVSLPRAVLGGGNASTPMSIRWQQSPPRTGSIIVSIDLVPVLSISDWPNDFIQKTWLMNSRTLRGSGYKVVMKPPHEESDMGKRLGEELRVQLWRISFPHLEVAHISSLESRVKDVYVTAKCLRNPAVCRIVLRDSDGKLQFVNKYLTSYMLKTVFMHNVEAFLSKNLSLAEMLMVLFSQLEDHLSKRFIPLFWVPRINLLEGLNIDVEKAHQVAKLMTSFVREMVLRDGKYPRITDDASRLKDLGRTLKVLTKQIEFIDKQIADASAQNQSEEDQMQLIKMKEMSTECKATAIQLKQEVDSAEKQGTTPV
ncbi:poly [ADP-ribose] polymerase tankyrase-2-like [Lineus longissimus]|uniref:poly [ADP-ribose] polymerase tankyrase-2-like n=1 Tax=Lineus longissimus TaxID=88925 RepID=UPI00315CA35F